MEGGGGPRAAFAPPPLSLLSPLTQLGLEIHDGTRHLPWIPLAIAVIAPL